MSHSPRMQPVIYRIRPEICDKAVDENKADIQRLCDSTRDYIRKMTRDSEGKNHAGQTLSEQLAQADRVRQSHLSREESYRRAFLVYFPRGKLGDFCLRGTWFLTYGDIEDRSFEGLSARSMTGHFKSGKEAYDWYVKGGR